MALRYTFADPNLNDALRDLWDIVDRLRGIKRQVIEGVTIRTNETIVAHGLGRKPQDVHSVSYGDARVWLTQAATKDFVYITASAEVKADIVVEG